MTRPVTLHPDATAELEAAAVWYDEQRRGLGLQFLAAIDRAVAHLHRWPDSGSPVPGTSPDLDLRRVPVARFPYHLVHLRTTDAIQVLAVAHDHRRPGYWRGREA